MKPIRKWFGCLLLSGMSFIVVLTFILTQKNSKDLIHFQEERVDHRKNISLMEAIANVLNNARQENGVFFQKRLVRKNNLPHAVQARQKRRQNDLLGECNKTSSSFNANDNFKKLDYVLSNSTDTKLFDSNEFRALYVNDDLRFIYCEVPKVACTNWKRILLTLTGKMNLMTPAEHVSADIHSELGRKYLKRLSDYSPEEIRHRLDTYYKFMFVRDPLERLLSAYQNKFKLAYNSYFHTRIGRKIIKQFRANASSESLRKGHDVTFPEFIRYLVSPKTSAELGLFNAHWRPFSMLCLPCTVRYDYIGKYETLHEDSTAVLKVLGFNGILKWPVSTRTSKTSGLLEEVIWNISQTELHQLWSMYRSDFTLFGYKYPVLDSAINQLRRFM